jgi:phosphoglycerate dehydrogenase-like enzyme
LPDAADKMMDRSHVWIRLELPQEELRSLEESAAECEFWQGKDAEADPRWLQRVDALFTEEPVPDELVQRMSNLRWLHTTRGGAYPFLTSTVRKRPIQLTTSKGIHGAAFSEFALGCIFALAKRLPQCWQAQSRRRWERSIPENVEGKTLGIIGLGTVGSELARKAKGLGLRVIATKRTVASKPPYVDELGPPEYLAKLLPEADFVVLCLASVPATEGILGEKELRSMKKSAYLINLTGARAVEEEHLVRALQEGWIAGAALDALPRQPLPEDSELWGLPNVIISPRIGGATAQRWDLLLPIFIDNLKRFAAGEELHNLVDKETGY